MVVVQDELQNHCRSRETCSFGTPEAVVCKAARSASAVLAAVGPSVGIGARAGGPERTGAYTGALLEYTRVGERGFTRASGMSSSAPEGAPSVAACGPGGPPRGGRGCRGGAQGKAAVGRAGEGAAAEQILAGRSSTGGEGAQGRGSYQREKSHSQSTRDRYAAEIADVLAEYDEEEVAMLVAAALSKREKATGRGLMLVKQCMVRKHAHLLPATQYAAMRSNVVLQPQASNGGKKRGADSRAPRASMP